MASLATARLGVKSRHAGQRGKTLRNGAGTNAVLFCDCQGDFTSPDGAANDEGPTLERSGNSMVGSSQLQYTGVLL